MNNHLVRRPIGGVFVLTTLFVIFSCFSQEVFAKNILGGLFGSKKKKSSSGSKEVKNSKDGAQAGTTETKEVKKKNVPYTGSHRFFAFDEAPYFTSPDKRIGAKMLIDSTKVGPTLAAMQHITFLPTAHIASHRHVYVTEVVYVLKGNLTLRIEKEVKIMGPDSTAYIPPQTFHEYLNDSQDVCQFLQFYSPSGPEEEYRNWEIPGEPKADSIPAKATGPVVINAPPNPVIPGSPQPVLGTVKELASETPSEPTNKSFNLELKDGKKSDLGGGEEKPAGSAKLAPMAQPETTAKPETKASTEITAKPPVTPESGTAVRFAPKGKTSAPAPAKPSK